MPLFELPATAYRTRFLFRIVSAIQWPFAVTFLSLRLFGHQSWLVHTLAWVACFPLWIVVTQQYSRWRNERLARQYGAKAVPCIQGRWPGNVDVMLRLAKDFPTGYALQAFTDLLDEYNCDTLNMRILWKDMIISRDDLVMKAVQSTQLLAFERGFESRELMGTFLGRGVFVTDGEEWRQNRALIRPFFNKERISDINIIDEHAEQVLSILLDSSRSNSVIDVQDLFARFTLDSGADFLVGLKTKSLTARRPVAFKARLGAKGAATDDDFGTFAYAFDHIQVVIGLRVRVGMMWPLNELSGDRTLLDAKVITDWIKPVVEEALREKAKKKELGLSETSEERTLLDSFVERTDDEAAVRYGLLNVLMASRDSTAALLSFTTYLLSLHPEVMRRLRQEVVDICGQSGRPSREVLQKMPYLEAVLSEALRLFPPAPMGALWAIEDTFVRCGDRSEVLHIPKGSRFNWITLALHRRKDFWGDDCEDFKPQRWLDPKMAARLAERPSMYIPFIQGPRMCPGRDFAKLEASYLLVRILQKFSRFELVPEALPQGAAPPEHWKHRKGRQASEKCWPSTAFTMFIKGGLWMRVHE
ncbi:cytochrome P450 monooxygenase CYP63 [Obba rivulosa]|uniref:Cytochrome P450 monooxygenase CYP63 n=1 Tax=Obba rivulosa TaxID=1052685 RepID=A0A8E2DJU7_9APHY|nr:cytochrome P450 monooxygenase CYP63 [Obba rivulosa]